ncbi:MAG TPA: protein phosphatase 2C domain-containing protein [Cellvibrionaceae bacterium]|nr:protein phosphatase 2C domain-containing protein [Cellvibrionaceae bacterium]
MPDHTRPQPFCWRAHSISHPGSVRAANEDAVLCRDEVQLWVVADGMGGHNRGDLASNTLVRHLERTDASPSLADAVDALEDSLLNANRAVLNYAQTHFHGAIMGSTFVAALIRGNLGFVAWAGDSRLYRLRRGQLQALTRDHSRVQELADQGRADPHAAGANIITRALGVDEFLPMDMTLFSAQYGDTFLLCSDGLYNVLDEALLIKGLSLETNQLACQYFLDMALQIGANDNVSAVVLRAVPWSAP